MDKINELYGIFLGNFFSDKFLSDCGWVVLS